MSDSPNPDPYTPPPVLQRAFKPLGTLPRHAQTWVVLGLAALMMGVLLFSGTTAPKARPAVATPEPASVVDANQARIQDYIERVKEQEKRLAAEQAQVAQVRQALGAASAASAGEPGPLGAGAGFAPAAQVQGDDPVRAAIRRGRADIAADRLRRDYEARFAPSLVLTHRHEPPIVPAAPPESAKQPPTAKPTGQPEYPLREGTVIETVLTNRLDGSFSGPINCMVTADVYSRDRRKLLIPRGSRVLGEVRQVESLGQQRLAVTFHRLFLPNGASVDLAKMPGLNQIGETGLVDRVNRHYLQVFGVSLAIGAIAGLNQATTRYGPEASTADVYQQGVTNSLAQSSLRILDRFLNVLPTFTIREGQRVKVYLTADLALPAYEEPVTSTDPTGGES